MSSPSMGLQKEPWRLILSAKRGGFEMKPLAVVLKFFVLEAMVDTAAFLMWSSQMELPSEIVLPALVLCI